MARGVDRRLPRHTRSLPQPVSTQHACRLRATPQLRRATFPQIALLLASLPTPGAAKHYWKYDGAKPHKNVIGKCSNFECPAFERPVPKVEKGYRPWIPKSCPNGKTGAPYMDALSLCCIGKYLCTQSCGVSFQDCHDFFWDCAERTCAVSFKDDNKECLAEASWNDMRFLAQERSLSMFTHMPTDKKICEAFQGNQRSACDCVPQAGWEEALKGRFEAFFTKYDPSRLNSKGKIKDQKAWKAWKGKRPEMFFRMLLSYKDKATKNVTFADPHKSIRDAYEAHEAARSAEM
jgi:hypothetical protein